MTMGRLSRPPDGDAGTVNSLEIKESALPGKQEIDPGQVMTVGKERAVSTRMREHVAARAAVAATEFSGIAGAMQPSMASPEVGWA